MTRAVPQVEGSEEGAGGEGSEPGEPVATATEAPSTPPPSEPSNPAPSEPSNPVQSDASSFANAGWVLFAALALLFVVTLIVMIARRGREPAPPAR